MNKVKQWLKKHKIFAIISMLVVLLLWWYFGEVYYVRCELIYQKYTDRNQDQDRMVIDKMSLDCALREDVYVPEEVEDIIKNYEVDEYDLLVVYGGAIEGLLLVHDSPYYSKPVSVKRDSRLISYYLIPNVGFIPDDWY